MSLKWATIRRQSAVTCHRFGAALNSHRLKAVVKDSRQPPPAFEPQPFAILNSMMISFR